MGGPVMVSTRGAVKAYGDEDANDVMYHTYYSFGSQSWLQVIDGISSCCMWAAQKTATPYALLQPVAQWPSRGGQTASDDVSDCQKGMPVWRGLSNEIGSKGCISLRDIKSVISEHGYLMDDEVF